MSPRGCKRVVRVARWLRCAGRPASAVFFASGCFLSFAPGNKSTQPSSWPEVTSLSVGFRHACAIGPEDRTLCWGENEYGQSEPPDTPMRLVSVGPVHTCGITKSDSDVVCWGNEEYGRVDAPVDQKFTNVSAGAGHTCGLTPEGKVRCWGSWPFSAPFPVAYEPPSQGQFKDISLGLLYGCALSLAGKVQCWGDDTYFVGIPDSVVFERLDAGFNHVCGLTTDGEVECWGAPTNEPNIPSGSYVDVSAGNATCALRDDGSFVCSNVGNPPHGPMTKVVAGMHHVCGVHEGGGVQCWKQQGADMENELTPPPQLHRQL